MLHNEGDGLTDGRSFVLRGEHNLSHALKALKFLHVLKKGEGAAGVVHLVSIPRGSTMEDTNFEHYICTTVAPKTAAFKFTLERLNYFMLGVDAGRLYESIK